MPVLRGRTECVFHLTRTLASRFTAHFPEYRNSQIDVLVMTVLAKDIRHAQLAELCPADVLALLPDTQEREFNIDYTFPGGTDAHGHATPPYEHVCSPLEARHGRCERPGVGRPVARSAAIRLLFELLSCREITVVYADREFTLQEWPLGLARAGLPICVRLRHDILTHELPAGDPLQRWQPGMTGIFVDHANV